MGLCDTTPPTTDPINKPTAAYLGWWSYAASGAAIGTWEALVVDGAGSVVFSVGTGITADAVRELWIEMDGPARTVRWRIDGAIVAEYVIGSAQTPIANLTNPTGLRFWRGATCKKSGAPNCSAYLDTAMGHMHPSAWVEYVDGV